MKFKLTNRCHTRSNSGLYLLILINRPNSRADKTCVCDSYGATDDLPVGINVDTNTALLIFVMLFLSMMIYLDRIPVEQDFNTNPCS